MIALLCFFLLLKSDHHLVTILSFILFLCCWALMVCWKRFFILLLLLGPHLLLFMGPKSKSTKWIQRRFQPLGPSSGHHKLSLWTSSNTLSHLFCSIYERESIVMKIRESMCPMMAKERFFHHNLSWTIILSLFNFFYNERENDSVHDIRL